MLEQGKKLCSTSVYGCHVMAFILAWFWVSFFVFLPPPPAVNNLIKITALSGLGVEQLLSAFQGVCEEVSFGFTGF